MTRKAPVSRLSGNPDKTNSPAVSMPEPRTGQPWIERADELLRLKIEAIETTGRGVIITNREGKIMWANRAMQQLTGYSPEEIIGENPRIFKSGRQTLPFYKQLWDTILSGKEWHSELLNRRKDGGLYVEQIVITPVRNGSGEIAHFIAIKQDITSERRAEERTTLLAMAVENSSELIASTDMEDRLTYLNPALLRALGRTGEEILGQRVNVLYSRNNPVSLVEQIAKERLESGVWSGECLMAGAGGKDVLVHLSTNAIKNDQGQPVGSVSIARDISENKHAENKLRESEELFRQLAENIREVFFITTPDPLKMIYVSPAYEEIWARKREQLYARPNSWIEAIYPEDRDRAFAIFQNEQWGAKTDTEYRILRPDGAIRWIRHRTYPVLDGQGHFGRVVGFAEDVTERKDAEKQLHDAHEKLNLALEDAQQRARVSEKLTDLVDLIQCSQTDEQAHQIIQEALGAIFESCADAGALCLTSASRDIVETVATWGDGLRTDRAFSPADCWALRRGKSHLVKNASSPVRCAHVSDSLKGGHLCVPLMAQGETLGLLYLQCHGHELHAEGKTAEASLNRRVRLAETVAERVSLALANLQLRQILRSQSVREPVTGLYNRRYMEETLDRELARAARKNESVALAMCDLDRFKEFNDTFGHEAGDLILREVASILRLKVRHGDIVCRFGGEEFVLILPEATADLASERTESIRRAVEALALSYRGHTLGRITISTGVAMFPNDGATAEDLLRSADQSLYRAKSQGRDRVVFFSSAG